jgi:dGTPase
VQSEIAVLKGLVASQVMTHNSRQPLYAMQRALLMELADALLANPSRLDAVSTEAWQSASSEPAKRRVVVDQVASLTDPAAIALHKELCS